jgi:hypothetical protein
MVRTLGVCAAGLALLAGCSESMESTPAPQPNTGPQMPAGVKTPIKKLGGAAAAPAPSAPETPTPPAKSP